jgi:polar amino acid transport system substrate-binding protein
MLKMRTFSTFLFALIAVTCTLKVDANSCKLTVQVIEYPPLAMKQANGDWRGLNFHYLDALFKEAGCRYQIVETPHARGIKLLENGQIDMTLNLSRTEEREAHFHFIGPQRKEVIRLAAKSNMYPKISGWSQFDGLNARFIWQIGAFYGENIAEKVEQNPTLKHKMLYSADNVAMVGQVNKGQADGFFLLQDFFHYQKAVNPDYANIELHPIVINSDDVYFALSKKSVDERMRLRFEKAFLRLVERDALVQIEAEYFKNH